MSDMITENVRDDSPRGGDGRSSNGPRSTGPATSARTWLRTRFQALRNGDLGALPVILGLIAVWVFFGLENSTFLSARNLSNLSTQMAVTAILAMAVVVVLVAGEIDLSLGSVTGVTSAVLGVLITNHHWAGGAAILLVLLLGAGIGVLQGLVTVLVGIPSFLVTLGGFLVWAGVQLDVIGAAGDLPVTNSTVTGIANNYLASGLAWAAAAAAILVLAAVEFLRHRAYVRAKTADPSARTRVVRVGLVAIGLAALVGYLNHNFGVPEILAIVLILAAGLGWILRRTVFGRHVYAIGGNAEASRRAGVPVGAVRVAVLGISGLLAAFAGIVSTANLYATSSGVGGSTLLLESIAAAVIGGTSLFGGQGRIYQGLLGALVVASIVNGLDLLGESAATEQIATGTILVLAVSLDAVSRRRRAATGR
jgi:D-xylose transport system permease protein